MKPGLISATLLASLASVTSAACPYGADSGAEAHANLKRDEPHQHSKRAGGSSDSFLDKYDVDDSDAYLTSDVGGPIADQTSLKAGVRGPTLLEDFIFRQKIMHFDHERVPERAVHARGAGAFGTFTSYADWSNYTAASFLGSKDQETPVFVRFSTVAGSRGSADTARDVHGFATRFYTDTGNFDIVGNNIPIFFIQDAIQFPDLIHAVKPAPDREIPQAATAHDSAWDFFSQQPSTLHTLFWAMSGHGIPRSYRHMDGFGIHTFRFVTEKGDSQLIRWHWKTKQGRASLSWEEAQHIAGMNADYHRQDLWDAIEAGNYPEYELCAQIMPESMMRNGSIDLLDPTKIMPVEEAPLHKLGVMRLDTNPTNYFAETEQVMFQPSHVIRGIDFSEDPLLQGRLFSYLDTQLNRNGGPNFEQLPINRPRVAVHNNNRDGAGQMFIHKNTAPYSPNTLDNGNPKQADQQHGKGFFTTPSRTVTGTLSRQVSSTFQDHWTQPRLFFNSLPIAQRQALVNAIRFEASHLNSTTVKTNVLVQLNRISHDVAVLVADSLGMTAPAADSTYYHSNTTADVSPDSGPLPTIASLRVGIMTFKGNSSGLQTAKDIKSQLVGLKLTVQIIGETLSDSIDITYAAADATGYDALVAAPGTEQLAARGAAGSTLYPARRPARLIDDSYNWGKPVLFVGSAWDVAQGTDMDGAAGVYRRNASDTTGIVNDLKGGISKFKFSERFPTDDTV